MLLDLKDVLKIIDTGEWFHNVTVIQANINKGTGGKILEIKKARIARDRTINNSLAVAKKYNLPISKNPNQNENFTRNIELVNKDIITIHPILIKHINGKSVL